MNKSLTKKTFSGALWLGGVKASNAIFQFLILAILARLLTPSEFGLIGMALIVTSFSDIFSDMGFGPAITQKKELSETDIHTGFTYSIIFGFILLLLLWVFTPAIASFFRSEELIPILRVISIVLLFRSVSTTPLGLMYRDMEFKKLSLIQIITYVLGYGAVGITLAYLGYGVWALVFAHLSSSFLALILYSYFNKNRLGLSFNKSSFKDLIHFGGGYSLSKVFSYVANKGDRVIVGRLLGADALGLYERGFQIVKYASSLLGEIIDKVLFSPIARKQDQREVIAKMYLELSYILAVLFFPFTGFMVNNAKPIVRIILGDQWDTSIPIVQIMSFSVFFLICTRIGSTVAKSLGDVYRRAWRTLFYAGYIIVATYIASKWGVVGVTIAVTIGTVINYLLAFGQVRSLTKVSYKQFFSVHGMGLILLFAYQIIFSVIDKFLIIKELNIFIQLSIGLIVLLLIYISAIIFDRKNIIKDYLKLLFPGR